MAAPRLFDFDLASILWVKQRKGELTRDEAAEVALTLQSAPIRTVDHEGLWLRALSLAEAVNHSPYDCAYVAAGLVAGAQAVITADRRFVRAFETWRAPGWPSRPYVLPVSQVETLPYRGAAIY